MVGAPAQNFGHAKRMRNSHTSLANIVTMTTIHCETCGCHYAIEHPSGTQDEGLAKRQALWLADRFVWDHIQENRHPGSIPLPILPIPSGGVR
jgi:hypothetical protein